MPKDEHKTQGLNKNQWSLDGFGNRFVEDGVESKISGLKQPTIGRNPLYIKYIEGKF